MTTPASVLAIARRNLGIVEGPNNANPYAKVAGHANNQPWCASFVVACFRRAGMKIGNESAYTPSLFNSMKQVKSPKVGDVIFFRWPSMGRIAHVGIIESIRPDGRMICIEGNTDAKGGRTGGKVMRQVRANKNTFFARPNYIATPPATKKKTGNDPILRQGNRGQKVFNVQHALNKHGFKVAEDSDFGPKMKSAVIAFQKAKKINADGVVGQKTWDELRKGKA